MIGIKVPQTLAVVIVLELFACFAFEAIAQIMSSLVVEDWKTVRWKCRWDGWLCSTSWRSRYKDVVGRCWRHGWKELVELLNYFWNEFTKWKSMQIIKRCGVRQFWFQKKLYLSLCDFYQKWKLNVRPGILLLRGWFLNLRGVVSSS